MATQLDSNLPNEEQLRSAYPAPDLMGMLRYNAQRIQAMEAKGESEFPPRAASLFYYERDLQGVPFMILGQAQFATTESKDFGPQKVVRVVVATIDLHTPGGRVGAPTIAQFSHKWLVSDFVDTRTGQYLKTINELRADIWTLAQDTSCPRRKDGQFPLRLKVYNRQKDVARYVDAEYDEEDMQEREEALADYRERLQPPQPANNGKSVTQQQAEEAWARGDWGMDTQPRRKPGPKPGSHRVPR